jgi:hypothetical protein
MKFNVHWPKFSPSMRAGLMFLTLLALAVAGSAGGRWS